jgi:hypothetical protein
MGTVDQIREWSTTNDFFDGSIVQQGKDVFIPSNSKYPHIHIGSDFITYSKTPSNHMYIVEKGSNDVNKGRVLNAFQDSHEAHIMQACRYMTTQF